MQNKKLIFIMGILVLVVGAAAFVAGRMLNGKVGPLDLGTLMGGGDAPIAVSVEVIPAPELPATRAEVVGQFVERQDKMIIVASISLEGGGVGVIPGSPEDENTGLKVDVLVTSQTMIYRETTDLYGPPSVENGTVQQTVEEGTLDDLNPQSFVMVWGRKSGDRVIADVLFYSNPVMFKKP